MANNRKLWIISTLIVVFSLFSIPSLAQHANYNFGDSTTINSNFEGWNNPNASSDNAWKQNGNGAITFSSFSTNQGKQIYFQSAGIKVEKGKTYLLTFNYSGKAGNKFNTFISTTPDGSTKKAKLEEYSVETTGETYTKEVTLAISSNSTYYLGFACDNNESNDGLVISNVKVIEYGTWSDPTDNNKEVADNNSNTNTVAPATSSTNKNTSKTTSSSNRGKSQNSKNTQKQQKQEPVSGNQSNTLASNENTPSEVSSEQETTTDSSLVAEETESQAKESKETAANAPEVANEEKDNGNAKSHTLLYIILEIIAAILAILAFMIYKRNNENDEKIADQQLLINNYDKAALLAKEKEIAPVAQPESTPEVVIPENFNLNNYTSELATINVFHKKISSLLQELIDETPGLKQRKRLVALKNEINTYNDKLLNEDFFHNFKAIHPQFFDKMSSQFSQLSKPDMTLCAYLYLGMSTKEIASLTDKEVRSVESARNRLRKKIGLDSGQDFSTYFTEIEKG